MTAIGVGCPVEPVWQLLAGRVVAAYGELERLVRESDLEPDEPTNQAFTELVALCGHRPEAEVAAVLADARVRAVTQRLRQLCAAGEFRLERCWARRIAAAADPAGELRAFPYLDNYRALAALEVQSLSGLLAAGAGAGRALARVCVLGSGPLPLTALLLARGLGASVEAVDRDAEATALARAVLRRLPGGRRVLVCSGEAADFAGVSSADLVVLAALVGVDPVEKQGVLARVADQMRPGAVLLVRSAHRLRTLLYPPITVDELTAASAGLLRPLAEIRPMTEVVNSFLVAVRS